MTSTASHNFDIGIDRDEFIRFHANMEAYAFRIIGCVIMFFVAANSLHRITECTTSFWLLLLSIPTCFIGGGTIAWLAGSLYGRTIARYRAARRADQFKVSVEGAFLRIIDLKSDRKIHFRQIVDYQIKDRNASSNIGLLSMMTTAGGQQNSTIVIPAIQNALETRDLLAEVDAQRE